MQYLQIRLFPAPTLDGGAFFSLLRFVLHTQAWSPIDRSLVFVQDLSFLAPVPAPRPSPPASVSSTSSSYASGSASSSAPAPARSHGHASLRRRSTNKQFHPLHELAPEHQRQLRLTRVGNLTASNPFRAPLLPPRRVSTSIPPLAATSAPVLRCVELFNFKFEFDLTFECEFGQQVFAHGAPIRETVATADVRTPVHLHRRGTSEGDAYLSHDSGSGFDSDFDMGVNSCATKYRNAGG
ncbi:hypothetical protein B0H13DRAFT_2439012 [Mycena leptocephala]|nr:hypothetical protein B0H13DRAFT_2439012 [Mycena leptocephala]